VADVAGVPTDDRDDDTDDRGPGAVTAAAAAAAAPAAAPAAVEDGEAASAGAGETAPEVTWLACNDRGADADAHVDTVDDDEMDEDAVG
jgi:hypothetical protein